MKLLKVNTKKRKKNFIATVMNMMKNIIVHVDMTMTKNITAIAMNMVTMEEPP